jgi:formamidopyrimidine-DNA glycosylase
VPELPEVQAHAERLDAQFAGSPLAAFQPLTFTALKTASPSPEEANGHDLVFVGRRGKYLLLDFGTVTFVVHLMQGGRLRPEAKATTKRPRNGVARWTFEDGRGLLLTEAGSERKAGVWVVSGDPEAQEPLSRLGPDADLLDARALHALLHDHPMRLHNFLRDQHVVAGLGRRLANEITYRAKLSPFAATAKLDEYDAERLVEAIANCVAEGLACERGLEEMSASADRPGSVHHREGQECPLCGDKVRAVEYRSYTIDYCPTCQTDGRVLADNTTSKFLK